MPTTSCTSTPAFPLTNHLAKDAAERQGQLERSSCAQLERIEENPDSPQRQPQSQERKDR